MKLQVIILNRLNAKVMICGQTTTLHLKSTKFQEWNNTWTQNQICVTNENMRHAKDYSYGTSITPPTWMTQVVNNTPILVCLCLSTKPIAYDHDFGVIRCVLCYQVLCSSNGIIIKVSPLICQWWFTFIAFHNLLYYGTNNIMNEIR